MKIAGRVWIFGDNVNTDEIIPARYLNTSDPAELAAHCMEDADPEFASKVQPGDIIVAGRNFGCGSSREHAPVSIKHAGVGCVVAASYARIFFRNAVNMGLWIFECPEAVEEMQAGDTIEIDVEAGTLRNDRTGVAHRFQAFSREVMDIVEAGGLMAHVKKEVERR
jgi:3-isopropylmalate/(R)-2-methylmalate dehydratase small subunit